MKGGNVPVRLAVVVPGDVLESWHARCIEHLQGVDGAELVALVVGDRSRAELRPRSPLSGLYARRLERRHLRNAAATSDVAVGVPRVRIADLEALRELGPDAVLVLGTDRPADSVLQIPRHGVWMFDFDLDATERVGLGALQRVLREDPVMEVALLRLTSDPGRSGVLRRGWFRADGRAPQAGLAKSRHESAKWPALVCASLRRGGLRSLEEPIVSRRSPHPFPGAVQLVRLGRTVAGNRARVAWGRLFRHHQWNIGLVGEPIQAFLGTEHHPSISWFPLEGRGGFLADPFGVASGDSATILCEHYDYGSARGTICRLDVQRGAFSSEPQPVLELPVHLSYPCIVEGDGALYCIPETLETREVRLFKADSLSGPWDKVAVLAEGVAAVDPTVFRHDGRWWLMFANGDTEPDADLIVWYADELHGPWTPHPANPVKTDVRSARPAGTPFVHEQRLYRPAQDCSRTYGGRIVVNEVLRLTPEEFAEEPAATIEPTADSPYPAGRHTLSALGDMTLIDGHRFVFVGAALRHFLRIWARDLLGRDGRRQ